MKILERHLIRTDRTSMNLTMAQQYWCYLKRLEGKHNAASIIAAETMLRLVMRTARNTMSAHVNFARLLPLRWSVLKRPLKHLVKTLIKSCKNLHEM